MTIPMRNVPCRIYRGGTSRGLLLFERDLPEPPAERDALVLRLMGSPDPRQIDGLGGANSQTSRIMIVSRATRDENADVEMLFGLVGIREPVVDWNSNCGNMTTAVGAFAVEEGLVTVEEPITRVRIRSRNTGSLVHVHVPCRDGRVVSDGDYAIPGVPGTASRIDLEWLEPHGSAGKGLFPSGRRIDVLSTGEEVSIVDAANPVAFVRASDLGLTGVELPLAIESQPAVMARLEALRSDAAARAGLPVSLSLPKIAIVSPPAAYETSDGTREPPSGHSLHARMLSLDTVHRSYAVSAAICTAAASRAGGTIVPFSNDDAVKIAHPYGVMDVVVRVDGDRVSTARVGRTARLLMTGVAPIG